LTLLHKLTLVAATIHILTLPYQLRRRQAQEAANKAKNPKSRDNPKGKFSHKENTESCSDGSRAAHQAWRVSASM
jgi:hypothetical protein